MIFKKRVKYLFSCDVEDKKIVDMDVRLRNHDEEKKEFITVFEDYGDDQNKIFYEILTLFYNFANEFVEAAIPVPTAKAELKYETTIWNFDGIRAKSMSFGELDFSNSEPTTIEVTWHYTNAIRRELDDSTSI